MTDQYSHEEIREEMNIFLELNEIESMTNYDF